MKVRSKIIEIILNPIFYLRSPSSTKLVRQRIW